MSKTAQKSDIETLKSFRAEAHLRSEPLFASDREQLFDVEFKRLAANDLKSCAWSREEVCLRITHLVGRPVTPAMLDAFLAESKAHRMPASMVPAWVRVTGSRRLLDFLCAASGMWAADETEHTFSELGRATLQAQKAEAKVSNLRAELWDKV